MSDTQKMQADGGGKRKGELGDDGDGVGGEKRASGGESGGGAYPNPHDPADTKGKQLPHGGQSDIGYTGPGQIGGKPVDGASGGQGG